MAQMQFLREAVVYGLTDPRDGAIRYVGAASLGLVLARYKSHLYDARSGRKDRKAEWLRGLLAEGIEPGIVLLETGIPEGERLAAERRWIAQHTDLVNSNTGGGGRLAGYHNSPEHNAAISAGRKGYVLPPESRGKMVDNQPHGKTYKITHPDGSVTVTKRLTEFAREHGLQRNALRSSAKRGSPRMRSGYRIEVVP